METAMEEKNVIQLQEEMRIKVAFDDLKDDDEADQRNACALFEKRFGVGAAKKLRARLGLVEVKVEEPKVKIARWRQLANGGWEYLLGGEIVWRRGFGPRPKQLDATDEPEEPKAAIGETGGETGWIEDDTNAANNIRRKLWRLEAALKWINRDDWWIVGAALWWMSEGNRSMGCQVFVAWAGEEFRDRWQDQLLKLGRRNRLHFPSLVPDLCDHSFLRKLHPFLAPILFRYRMLPRFLQQFLPMMEEVSSNIAGICVLGITTLSLPFCSHPYSTKPPSQCHIRSHCRFSD
jgi:hypothetical protein